MMKPAWIGLVVAIALPACASPDSPEARAKSDLAQTVLNGDWHPEPVIYDTDMDFDDAAALAYLCQEHKQRHIDLRAVTVTNAGFGLPGRALQHARSILVRCGLPEIPVADGSEKGVHSAPPEFQNVAEQVLSAALGDGNTQPVPSALTAPELMVATLAASERPVHLLSTAPLTNVANALRLNPKLVIHGIGHIDIMAGAFTVPGNLVGSTTGGFDNTQDFNTWLDPAAARDVLTALPMQSASLTPLDATQYVPITKAYIDRLGAEGRTAEAQLVHSIVTQPPLLGLIEAGGFYWWDPLAALGAFGHATSAHKEEAVTVVQDGASSGRMLTGTGTLVDIAFAANEQTFEDAFLEALNGSACTSR